jgi:DNA-binding transcriptional ArsR family regulator
MVVFEKAAAEFAVLSTPIRLRIISELCQGGRNVEQLLGSMDVAQTNMSPHLNMMYGAGVWGERRQGAKCLSDSRRGGGGGLSGCVHVNGYRSRCGLTTQNKEFV